METEKEKFWQDGGLGQNRIQGPAPPPPHSCHPQVDEGCVLCLSPTSPSINRPLPHFQRIAAKEASKVCARRPGRGGWAAVVQGHAQLEPKQFTFVWRAGSPPPTRPRKTGESGGCQGSPGMGGEAWPTHGPFPARTAPLRPLNFLFI